jgi:hypothetical protein
MMPFYYLSKRNTISTSLVLGLCVFLSCSIQAQVNVPNSRPTLDPIPDYTTSLSTDIRYIELNGITPGEETDQQVSLDVSTEDKDLIESIGVDLVDNGKAVINYLLKGGAAGTATVKVVVKDNGVTPSSFTRTFHIIIEALNRDLPTKSLLEEPVQHLLKAVPNPVLVTSRVFFSTPNDEQSVVVDLYTLSGSKIKQLFTGSTLAGQSYYVDVNSRSLAAGVYIVRLTGQSHTSNLRLVVAK